MDTKSVRRNFYKNKVYLSDKLDQKYTTERFPEDIQLLLDEYIPNATLKQLTKFMEKKYHRIIKTFPEVEKALKKVLREKLGKIPEEMRKTQIQKLLSHLKEYYPNYEFELQGDGNYKMISKEKGVYENDKKDYLFEQIYINVPNNAFLNINSSKKNTIGKGLYTVIHQNPEYGYEVNFASTYELQDNDEYKLDVKNGNFDREANNLLDKFNLFKQRMDNIENPQE